MKDYQIADIQDLFVLGRTTKERNPLTLFWTGSGIECNVKARELWIEIEADYDMYEPWISIIIDGAYISRRMVEKGKQWICVFRNMNPEIVKNIKVLKEVQAMPEDEKHCLQIHNLRTDGSFEKVEEKPYKIEFIGDSITSGEGSIGAKQEEDWISMWFSTQNNYAVMIAQALNADYHIISQSGWGVYSAWDNNPHNNLPDYYEQVCGVIKGNRNRELGAGELNDFKSWQPDAIVVNLGTNDDGAFHSPKWQDEVTGESHEQRMNADGTYEEASIKEFKHAVYAFLKKLRKYNPNAQILWVYGMLGMPMKDFIEAVIKCYKEQERDTKVEFLLLQDTTEETIGARQHPGVLAHKAAAKVLIEEIKNCRVC